MIVSVHLAKVGPRAVPGILRRRPDPKAVAGMRYAETTITAPLGKGLLPRPSLGRAGMIAAWDDDAALDRFLDEDPLAEQFSSGWMARMEPLHVYGALPGLPGLPTKEISVAEDQPVAVLTIGQLRLRRAGPFLKASARAEGEALADPAMLASTGLARPPRMVATFSIWRDVEGMREYARGRRDGAHPAATAEHRAKSFHHESAFIRFRPYATQGSWGGRDPLAL
ncbi:MAG TPA: hypothetical protein VII45_06930 [Solirubrobacterales bacterium]